MLVWTRTDRHSEVERREPCALGEMWKRTGFMRHADEFWLLARLTLDKARYHQPADGSGAASIFNTGGARAAGVTYDDNDMEQVRNLVSDFQGLCFI